MKTSSGETQTKRGLGLILRALKYRNYRLFFFGQSVSLIGTWMQMAAVSWLVYRITGSVFYLGLVSFCDSFPVFLGAPFAGVIADRISRRQIVILTQILSMLQAFILAALMFYNSITLIWIILLSVFKGIINAFDMPSRQAFVYEMVDNDEDLPNAIALNSMVFNLARLIGPPIAGFIIALRGETACFFINGVSFLAVIFSLYAMKLTRSPGAKHDGPILAGIKDGLKYAFGFIPIRAVLIYTALISLVAIPYSVLMPVFAKTILLGSSKDYGFLLGSVGIGAFLGALFLARRKTVQGLETVVVIAAAVFAAGIICFSFSRILWLSIVLAALPGFGVMVQMASINTILQTLVDDDKRGRVFGLHVMAFIGMMPLGHLLAGTVAHYIGSPNTMLVIGFFSIVIMIFFAKQLPAIRKMIHPVYIRKGIMPQMAEGLNTASVIATQAKD
jgi:MFS family permease